MEEITGYSIQKQASMKFCSYCPKCFAAGKREVLEGSQQQVITTEHNSAISNLFYVIDCPEHGIQRAHMIRIT